MLFAKRLTQTATLTMVKFAHCLRSRLLCGSQVSRGLATLRLSVFTQTEFVKKIINAHFGVTITSIISVGCKVKVQSFKISLC